MPAHHRGGGGDGGEAEGPLDGPQAEGHEEGIRRDGKERRLRCGKGRQGALGPDGVSAQCSTQS